VSGAIRATGISYTYPGGVHAVDGVDLSVDHGELLFVLGPNGSGKSTLLQVMSGVLPADAGEIELDGTPLQGLTVKETAKRIAVVPQAVDGVDELLVEDFVAGGRYAHLGPWRRSSADDDRAITLALDRADAADVRRRRMGELSGGQRQRALIARALAQETPTILLDEPTAALDPEHQVSVLRLVRELADAGAAVVVVTHDLNLTTQFASRVLLLDKGRAVAEGPVRDVLTPGVLEPIYGSNLFFGTFPDGRPLVVPHGS
jgi:iron complex transport system ATP-binding protein